MSKSAFLQPGASFMSGRNVIGEVTESIQKFIMDGWTHYNGDESPPRIEEDLKYEPMDRNEKVIFVYMYRLANNPNLQNQKRWRQAPVFMKDDRIKHNVIVQVFDNFLSVLELLCIFAQ